MKRAWSVVMRSPYTVVSVASLWLTRSFWLPGRYVDAFDTYTYSGPNIVVSAEAYRSGRVPLLNDWIFGGAPHLGNHPSGVLYPPKLLAVVLEANRAMGVLVALHVVLLGAGMVLLARRIGIGSLGATVAGLVAVGAGATLTKSTQFEQILVLAWAPLLLAAIHATLGSSDWRRPTAATAGVTAAVLLAGHPQLVYEVAFLAAGGTVAFVATGRSFRRLPHVVAGAALGAAIAAPQLLASLQAVGDSAVSGGRDEAALFSPALRLLPPNTFHALLGTVLDRDPAVFSGTFEAIVFVGVVAVALSIVGWSDAVLDAARRPVALVLGGTGLLALAWAYGPRTIVFRAAFRLLPGFDLGRASARWLVVTALVVALFAGLGAEATMRRLGRRHVFVVAGAAGAAALLLASGRFATADGTALLVWGLTALGVLGVLVVMWRRPALKRWGSMVLVGGACLELVAMSLHSLPQRLVTDVAFTARRTPIQSWIASQEGTTIAFTDDIRGIDYDVAGLRPNANVLARIRSIDGYDGGAQLTTAWVAALRRFDPEPDIDLPLRNAVKVPAEPVTLARLGVRWILLDRNRPPAEFVPGWLGPRAGDDRFTVWENPAWIGEAVAWPAAVTVAGSEPADLLRTDPARYAVTAIVDRLDAPLSCEGAGCEPVGVPVVRRSAEHLEVDLDLQRRSVLMVDRQALRGWTVTVDGRTAPLLVVDGLFLGVDLPPGRHQVVWRYHQPGLVPTLILACLALVATVLLASGRLAIRAVGRRLT